MQGGKKGEVMNDLRFSVFEASVVVSATPEQLFQFHSDPANLIHVMPPTLRLVNLETEGPAKEGSLIKLHCVDWGVFPMRWVCRWMTVSPPHLLVDELLTGPFRKFEHEHRFDSVSMGCSRMTDRVTFAWGRSWWGRLVSETAVRTYLWLLFAYRHYRTQKWAESQINAVQQQDVLPCQ